MKKAFQILFFAYLTLSVFTVQAQISVGFRGGVNIANYTFKSSSDKFKADKLTLLTVGVPVEFNFNKYFALQAELNFVQKGFKLNEEQSFPLASSIYIHYIYDYNLKVNWLEIPVLAKVKFRIPKLDVGLFLGPSIGYALNVKSAGATTTNIVKDGVIAKTSTEEGGFLRNWQHNRLDVGLNVGGEINYKRAYLDIRYQLGFIDMLKNTNLANPNSSHSYTRGLALTVGYRIWTKIKKQ
jgi:hypothetical protein